MSGYRIPFSANIDNKFNCKSCGHLLRDAVQTLCGHLYCENCLLKMLEHERVLKEVKCLDQNCSSQIGNGGYFPDNHTRREILQITTPCLNKDTGCDWIGEVRSVEDHYKECEWRPVTCVNFGCNKDVPLNTLAKHQEEECPFRDVVCNFCNKAIKWADQANHSESCENLHVTCGNCGKENIQLCELKRHQDAKDGDCTQKECPYRDYGCEHCEKMDPKEFRAHLDADVVPHSLLVLPHQRGMNDHRMEANAAELSALKETLAADEKVIAEHEWALQSHYQEIRLLKEDMEKLKNSRG